MGPRHYSRGNGCGVTPCSMVKSQFQWGHDITVVETSLNICANKQINPSFNGGTTLQSWKQKEYIKFRFPLISFNGATTLQSWKRYPAIQPESIRPLFQWGHDITVVETNK